MEYIRLKNKIVEIEAEDSECYYFNKLKKFVYKDEGYRVANTMKELCDVYVLDERLYYKIEDLRLFIKQLKELNRWPDYLIKPYGAIWTDKGLIYVTKKKGILPNGEIDWELI